MPKINKGKGRKGKGRKGEERKGKKGALPNHGTFQSDPPAEDIASLIQDATAKPNKELTKALPKILQTLKSLEDQKIARNHAFCLFKALHSKWKDPDIKTNARKDLHKLMIEINDSYKLGHRYETSSDTWLLILSPQESAAMEERRLNTDD